MSDPANQLNVPSDAPIDVFRSPNEDPQFDTTNTDVNTTSTGKTVNSPGTTGVVIGSKGKPVQSGS